MVSVSTNYNFGRSDPNSYRKSGQKLTDSINSYLVSSIVSLTNRPVLLAFIIWFYSDLISVHLTQVPWTYKIFIRYLKYLGLDPYSVFPRYLYIIQLLVSAYCRYFYGVVNILVLFIPFLIKPSNKNFFFFTILFLLSIGKIFKWIDFIIYGICLIIFSIVRSVRFKLSMSLLFVALLYFRTYFELSHVAIPVCDLCAFSWVRIFDKGHIIEPPVCLWNSDDCHDRWWFVLVRGVIDQSNRCDCYIKSKSCQHINTSTVVPTSLELPTFLSTIKSISDSETRKSDFQKILVTTKSPLTNFINTSKLVSATNASDDSHHEILPSPQRLTSSNSTNLGFNVTHTKYPDWLFNKIDKKVYFYNKDQWFLMEDQNQIRPIASQFRTDSGNFIKLAHLVNKNYCPNRSYFEMLDSPGVLPPITICPIII